MSLTRRKLLQTTLSTLAVGSVASRFAYGQGATTQNQMKIGVIGAGWLGGTVGGV